MRTSPRACRSSFDRTPQRILDRILWQHVHGADSEPPPPGPNASGLNDEAEIPDDDELLRELRSELRRALIAGGYPNSEE